MPWLSVAATVRAGANMVERDDDRWHRGLIIVVPILMPIATGVFGIDPFHFGVVVCINLVLGLLTPPVGAGLYVVADMSGARPAAIFLALLPFVLSTIAILVLLSWQPVLVTGLISG